MFSFLTSSKAADRMHIPVPCLGVGKLSPGAHKPQNLFNSALEFFSVSDNKLTQQQLQARKNFVALFKVHQHDNEISESVIRSLFIFLDTFFFAKAVSDTRNLESSIHFGDDIFKQAKKPITSRLHGLTRNSEFPRLEPDGRLTHKRCVIFIDATNPWPKDRLPDGKLPRCTLTDVLETLTHEMVHAYLESFGCGCDECQRRMGPEGHGELWENLHESMVHSLHRFDSDLRSVKFTRYSAEKVLVDEEWVEVELDAELKSLQGFVDGIDNLPDDLLDLDLAPPAA